MDRSGKPVVGVVLSGGGARGAYEVGVLKYIFEAFGQADRSLFQVLTGTSVGAVHAAYFTGSEQGPTAAVDLVKLWTGMRVEETVKLNWRWIRKQVWRYLFASDNKMFIDDDRPGFFDTSFLERLIFQSINWRGIQRSLTSGHVKALAVPSTEISTGNAMIFYQSHAEEPQMIWRNDPNIIARPVKINPRHVLASAAIPMFFPPVMIDKQLYVDGSLRINTPLSPALRLGADRLLVIRLRAPHVDKPIAEGTAQTAAVTDPVYLAGKAFDAIMLDPVDRDLRTLDMINALIARSPADRGHVSEWSQHHRGAVFHEVQTVAVSPSESVSVLATEALRRLPKVPRMFRRYLDSPSESGDLVSFFLFDAEFTGSLIDLGYRDAKRAHDDIATLFG